jgi:hypothetical protein
MRLRDADHTAGQRGGDYQVADPFHGFSPRTVMQSFDASFNRDSARGQ